MSKEFNLEQLQLLMEAVNQNEISELLLESGETRLRIRGKQVVEQVTSVDGPTAVFMAEKQSHAQAPAVSPVQQAPAAPVIAPVVKCINSPIVGTFYNASAPDKEPFVKVGQTVKEGDIVFIVESMKVMNEVPADKSGVVAEVLVDNGAPVEYGQAILRLE